MGAGQPSAWPGRDYLNWKQTGAFAANLMASAKAANDPRLIAYATGWQVSFASLLFLDPTTGMSAISTGIQEFKNGASQLNWDQTECQLYWLGVYVYTALDALHEAAVLGGFIQPYAFELAAATETVSFDGNKVTYTPKAYNTCLSSSDLVGPPPAKYRKI